MPRSSTGRTFNRFREKIRNISAVHRPIPRIIPSDAMIWSFDCCSNRLVATRPSRNPAARSLRYRTFWRESPAARSLRIGVVATVWGVGRRRGYSAAKRSKIAAATLADSCWEIIESQSVTKYWRRGSRWHGPTRAMSRAMTGSASAKCRQAAACSCSRARFVFGTY